MRDNDLRKHSSVEYYIDGKLFKTCSYSKWDVTEKLIYARLRKKGYESFWVESLMNKVSFHAKCFYNLKLHKIIVLEYKVNTGHCDIDGNPIYQDDIIENDYFEATELNTHYDNEHYYLRYGNKDFNIEPIALEGFRKVQDVLKIPKRYWKKPQRTRL